MNVPIELASLNCIRCSANIPAATNEIGWICAQCGQPQRLFEGDELVELRLHYSKNIPAGKSGRAFWVAPGKVDMSRETYNTLFGKKAGEAMAFWGQQRNFFVPAFTCSMDKMIELSTTLVAQQPTLVEGPPAPFTPITVRIEDFKNLIEFVVLAIEAERSDDIKILDFSANIGKPDLWVLP